MSDYNFDLLSLDTVTMAEEGVEFIPNDPVYNKPIQMTTKGDVLKLILYGIHSTPYSKARNKIIRKATALAQKSGNKDVDPKQDKLLGIEYTAELIKSWENFVIKDKNTGELKEIPFSIGNAKKYLAVLPWLQTQIENFTNNQENFMQR